MKRFLIGTAVVLLAGCQASEAQRPPSSPSQVAADRIARQNLLSFVLRGEVNASIIEAYASHTGEALGVSIASVFVGVNREFRDNEHHAGTLKSSAELADTKVKLGLEMLSQNAADRDYIANVVKVASVNQQVANDPKSLREQIELKWLESFTTEDAKEIVQLLPLLPSAADSQALSRARASIQQQLERSPELLAPFKAIPAPSSSLAAARQRVSSLISKARGPNKN